MGQSKVSKKSKSKGRNKREFKCHECGKFGLGVRSREASVFEASKRSLAETRCVDMVNVDLNALEIGAVLLLVRNHKIQVGIDSCAVVTVFVHFRWFVTKTCKSCMDLSARKVKGKLRGVPFWYANPRMAETCEVLVAVSESDMSHDVLFPLSRRRYPSVCVRRGMWNETGAGVKRSLRIASRECSSQCSDDWKERGKSGLNSSLSELEQNEGVTIAIASSEQPKCLKCAGPCILWKERG